MCSLEVTFFFFCRLNDEARRLISDLGSSAINALGFRDNWIFVGGKGIKTKSPFEQVIQSHVYLCALKLSIMQFLLNIASSSSYFPVRLKRR